MASFTLYNFSVPTSVRVLRSLSAFLKKGESYAAANNITEEQMLSARLAPDMFPLAYQILRACETIRIAVSRMSGGAQEPDDHWESSFAWMQQRIAATIAYLESVPKEALEGKEEEIVVMTDGGKERRLAAVQYLGGFVFPNSLFHVSIAYALLRQQGVPVGKSDFLGVGKL